MKGCTNHLCALFLLLAPAAGAQPTAGDVRISDLAVSRGEGKLFVSMTIDLSAVRLSSNRETTLTPLLAEGGDTLRLEPVTVAGRNRYYYRLRNGLTPVGGRLLRAGDASQVAYRVVVPYEAWMGSATVDLARETNGCCAEPIARAEERLTLLDLDPKPYEPRFVYAQPAAEQVKVREMKGSAYVDFPVNRTEIREDYRRNPEELQRILRTIAVVRDDPDTRITSVSIKGYASPEGPWANNERLAKGRTEALRNYVGSRYDFPEGLIATSYEPEDWAGLERYVAGSDLKHRDEILAIIRGGLAPDARDRKIRTTYPEEYAFLLREVYPALRHSDYAVTYEVRTYTDAEEIRRLLRTAPQKLSLQEMYLAAQGLTPGSEEFDELFAIAVRMFPDDETANLNAANAAMQAGDLKRADRYLDKAGATPEARYARAVRAALAEDYETAARLFEEAQRDGVGEAGEALERIRERQAHERQTLKP